VNFVVDSQLPPALARWLAAQGHQARHVADLGLAASNDTLIWEQALKTEAIIISKDEDFVDRWLVSRPRPAVIWLRKGNCSNRALMAWLEPLWPETVQRLEQGEKLIELRA
jgi:predicted nuclease of predicted toxin-antitoxin system